METPGNGSLWRQCKGRISLSVMLMILLRLDGTLADKYCPSFKDKIIELQATNTSERIYWPNLPDQMSIPPNCVAKWRITSDGGFVKFQIDSQNMLLNGSSNDNLTFYDGYNSSLSGEPMLSVIWDAPQRLYITHYVTSSKYLEIVFKSDSITITGNPVRFFTISYETEDACECNGPTTILQADNTTKTLVGPKNPYNCKCQWLIQGEKDVVMFTVDEMYYPYSTCDNGDYVKFYDGSTSTNTTLIRKMCRMKVDRSFYTSAKNGLVLLESDFSDPVLEFKIDYQTIDVCADAMISDDLILLHYYFRGRMPKSTCSWVITNKEDIVVLLISIEFLKKSCNGDFIEVYEGNSIKALWRRACQQGTAENITLTSSSKFVHIKLQSAGGISDFSIGSYSDNEFDDDSLSSLKIALIAVGSVITCILVGVLIMLLYRRRKRARNTNNLTDATFQQAQALSPSK